MISKLLSMHEALLVPCVEVPAVTFSAVTGNLAEDGTRATHSICIARSRDEHSLYGMATRTDEPAPVLVMALSAWVFAPQWTFAAGMDCERPREALHAQFTILGEAIEDFGVVELN